MTTTSSIKCDLCGCEETLDPCSDHPFGWGILSFTNDSDYYDSEITYDLCTSCKRIVKAKIVNMIENKSLRP